MFFKEDFAKKLKEKRKEKGLSQKELAEKLLYSEKTVSKWECGTALPPLSVFAELCRVLGVESKDLLFANTENYYLGIDGGGTKTAFVLCDSQGNVVKTYLASGCNPVDIGYENMRAVLNEGITAVCSKIPYSAIRVFAGVAGAGLQKNREALEEAIRSYGFAAYAVGSDNENLISAALGDEDGITVIMGTGFCLYRVIDGQRFCMGGYGQLFDEGGSAVHFGQHAWAAAFAHMDGNGAPTVLTELLQEKMGLRGRDCVPKLYAEGKRFIGSFAPLVFQAAAAGDKVAEEIICKNISAVAKRIEFAGRAFENKPVKVVLAGGLTKAEGILDRICGELTHPEDFEISILQTEVVSGAVRLARKL